MSKSASPPSIMILLTSPKTSITSWKAYNYARISDVPSGSGQNSKSVGMAATTITNSMTRFTIHGTWSETSWKARLRKELSWMLDVLCCTKQPYTTPGCSCITTRSLESGPKWSWLMAITTSRPDSLPLGKAKDRSVPSSSLKLFKKLQARQKFQSVSSSSSSTTLPWLMKSVKKAGSPTTLWLMLP